MLNPDETAIAERRFGVTPLDVRNARFKTAMRGFDRDDVMELLRAVADDYESALRENERLRQELVRQEAALNQHRELEGSLRNTLVSAQKVADDMRETARQEATRIVSDAEARGDALVQHALSRAGDAGQALDALLQQRRAAEAGLEESIAALTAALATVRLPKPAAPPVAAPAPTVIAAVAPAPVVLTVALPAGPQTPAVDALVDAAGSAAGSAEGSAVNNAVSNAGISAANAAGNSDGHRAPHEPVATTAEPASAAAAAEPESFEQEFAADLALVVGHRTRADLAALAG